jgi:hypothetical protein
MIHRIACVLAIALSLPAAAATLYKSTMPDGRIVYGGEPAPGAKRVDTVEPPPAQTGVTAATPQERARAQTAGAAARPSSSALDDARRQLQSAEAALEAGKEPLPGERQGIARGGSRLTDAYEARQQGLQSGVDAARKRVQELERGR